MIALGFANSRPPHRLAGHLAVALSALVLGGCSLFDGGRVFGGKSTLEVAVSPDLNNDYAVAVDLVVVYTKKAEGVVGAQVAAAWFGGGKKKAVKDFGDSGLSIVSWEWIPGQSVKKQIFKYRSGARTAFVFAGYSSPGDHRQTVKPNKKLALDLGATDFVVTTN